MYFLYSVVLGLGLVLGSPYWLWQALRHGKYRKGLAERLGRVPQPMRGGKETIWVHAVSVGEVLAVSELVQAIRREFPECRVVVSTTTDTGQKLAASRFGAENVFYFPFDFAFAVRNWISALRPKLILIAETEFWPNLLRLGKKGGARVMVVNARISDRSFPGYRRWRVLLRRVLAAVDVFLAQTEEDAARLIQIGARKERVVISGNLKYDIAPPREVPIVKQLRASLQPYGAGPVLVCGSTVEGEETVLLNAFKTVLARHSRSVMLLAPRHPERFEAVGQMVERAKLKLRRRSQWNQDEDVSGAVMVLDSIGELSSIYSLADVAFVGGSLVPRGGHNILEPAQYRAAILVGEYTDNFRDIIDLFRKYDAVRVVGQNELAEALVKLLENQAERRRLGERAAAAVRSQQGATKLTLEKVRDLIRACEVTHA